MRKIPPATKSVVPESIWFALLCLVMLLCHLPWQQAEASTIIDTVQIQLPSPTRGAKVSSLQASTTTTGVVVTTNWFNPSSGSNKILDQGFIFNEGTFYAQVKLTPSTGYRFTDTPTVVINDIVVTSYSDRTPTSITTSGPVTTLELISSVQVQLPVPTLGAKVSSVQPTATTAGVRIDNTTWYHLTNGVSAKMLPNDTFGQEGAYYCTIELVPTGDNLLAGSSTIASINGVEASYSNRESTRMNFRSISYSFPPTMLNGTFHVQVPAPSRGQAVSGLPATTTASGVRIAQTTWYQRLNNVDTVLSASTTFGYGTYFCQVEIEPMIGYVFSIAPIVAINGETQSSYVSRGTTSAVVTSPVFTIEQPTVGGVIPIQVPSPIIGQEAADVKATTSATEGSVTGTVWYHRVNQNTDNVMYPGDVFGEGTYYCKVRVVPPRGSKFASSPSATINGTAVNNYDSRTADLIVATSPVFTLSSVTTISRIDVQVADPTAGQTVSAVQATSSTTGVNLVSTKWYRVVGSTNTAMSSGEKFAAGESYYCEVESAPMNNYAFSSTTRTYFNNKEASYSQRTASNNVAYGANIQLKPNAPASKPISEVKVQLPEPVAGKTPKDAVPTTSTEGLNSIVNHTWNRKTGSSGQAMLATDVFTSGETYYCALVLTYDEGYSFASSVRVLMNGIEASFKASSDGKSLQGNSKEYALLSASEDATANQLLSIMQPKAITDISNGAVKTVAGLKLPASVTLVTYLGEVAANISWQVGSSSYDVNKTTAQTFSVQGLVTLPSGVTNEKNISLTVSVSVSVNALGDETEEFTVRYQANGGTGTAPAAATVQGGATHTTLANMFARTGYEFTGWGTSASGGTLYAAGASIKVEANIVLYAQWKAAAEDLTNTQNNPEVTPPTGDTHTPPSTDKPGTTNESATIVFTIDSKIVTKNGIALPEIDVPAMIINGRTMIPFRYFIETALGGTANFDASTYTITATVRGHTFVMVVDKTTFSVDGKVMDLPQAPTIVDSRTLVPLRLVETIAQSVGWDPLTRKATIIL